MALWLTGIAFKAGTDDTRDSPGLRLAELLDDAGSFVEVHDSIVSVENCKDLRSAIQQAIDIRTTVEKSDAIIVTTNDDQYKELPEIVKEVNPSILVYDARRQFDPRAFENYLGIGYGS